MKRAVSLVLATGCSVFSTKQPHPMWRAQTSGPTPDCVVSQAPMVLDVVLALAATAVVIAAETHECGGFETHDDGCDILRNLATGVSAPLAITFGMSALVGRSRNHGCETARTAYTTANPGWPTP